GQSGPAQPPRIRPLLFQSGAQRFPGRWTVCRVRPLFEFLFGPPYVVQELLHLLPVRRQPRGGLIGWNERYEVLARLAVRYDLFRARPGVLRAGEDAVERVIILLRDRVELMVVTPRAAQRQAEERLPH